MNTSEVAELERELLQNEDLDEDDNEEKLTAQDVLEIIEKAWLNEKFSPEILPHKTEYVDCMLEQIKYMESNISFLQSTDIQVDIYKFELERIRYIITSYLRCRLRKIELYAFYVLEQETTRNSEDRYLSDSELKFAVEYIQNLDIHFDSILKKMPWNLQTLEDPNKRIKPNMDSYVFLRANKSVSNVIIKDVFENREEEVELLENSQHLLPYSSVVMYIKDKSVQLL
ncbi:hypothetical protein PGB90_008372 [Kerria lacca]